MTKTAVARLLVQASGNGLLLSARPSRRRFSTSRPRTARSLRATPPDHAELAQFDFLAGDWDVTVTMPRAGSQPLVYHAKWHNHWIANGYVMMQEWRGPYATGTELRSFNPVTHKWDGHNLYVPEPGTWYENEAELVGGDMVVTRHTKTPDGTPLINREVYHAISADRFEIRTEASLDEGVSWRPGRYSLVATRIRP